MPDKLSEAIEELKAVLCDPEGNVSINGSKEDCRIIKNSLYKLEQLAQSHTQNPGGVREILEGLTCPECKAFFGDKEYEENITQAEAQLSNLMGKKVGEEEIEKILIDNCYYEDREDKMVLNFAKVAKAIAAKINGE